MSEAGKNPEFVGMEQIKKEVKMLPTPCYLIDEAKLKKNGEILAGVSARTGCKILLAQKAFSNYDCYPLLSQYLAGTEASGLYEARLGAEEMPGKEVHVFCGAYREEEFTELLRYADHIVFNSVHQLAKFGSRAKEAGKSIGLRINPECSTQDGHAIYDPCATGSRLGVTRDVWNKEMKEDLLELLDGLHFHTLCEQDADALEITIHAVEEKFGDVLPQMKWLNMGGGHHITKPGYDVEKLEQCINYAKEKWQVEVYLEPGEAVALNAGYLATKVLDVVENNGIKIAILDASAACHMPDVIEMPYTPPLQDAVKEGYRYRLAGPTCLAGDVIGDYYFKQELKEDDLLIFEDMVIYTTCKNNTFNGIPLPNIWKRTVDGKMRQLTSFGYEDFKYRLGSN
ncbi:MAG: carboxynorspermidine decarboxylase [Lachnospiraceae bacterium]|nr:carboxynorspermidine decarboxylase [Lachnospiraceae bacterium]